MPGRNGIAVPSTRVDQTITVGSAAQVGCARGSVIYGRHLTDLVAIAVGVDTMSTTSTTGVVVTDRALRVLRAVTAVVAAVTGRAGAAEAVVAEASLTLEALALVTL